MNNHLRNVVVGRIVLPFLLILLLPVLILMLFVECVAALLHPKNRRNWLIKSRSRPSVTVLMPAFNEEITIGNTINSVVPQLSDRDQLVVIADNCTDRTAQIARNLGATVIERQDRLNKSKSFALDYGLRYIAKNPPEIVILLDADCQIKPNYIEHLAQMASQYQRPVQPINLLQTVDQNNPKSSISEFAFMVKNLVRPLGLAQLNLPCMVTMGTAFPWSIINQVPLTHNNLVEDMQFGIDLAIAGNPTLFCSQASVMGVFPRNDEDAEQQRTRWEHGHIATLMTQVPRLLKEAWQQKRPSLLFIALDLSIPPLSFLVTIWFAKAIFALIFLVFLGTWAIVISSVIEGFMLFTAIFLAWLKFGSQTISWTSFLSILKYIFWKKAIYINLVKNPQQEWVKTKRDLPNILIPEINSELSSFPKYTRSK